MIYLNKNATIIDKKEEMNWRQLFDYMQFTKNILITFHKSFTFHPRCRKKRVPLKLLTKLLEEK